MNIKAFFLSLFVGCFFLLSLNAALEEGDLVPYGMLKTVEGDCLDVPKFPRKGSLFLFFIGEDGAHTAICIWLIYRVLMLR